MNRTVGFFASLGFLVLAVLIVGCAWLAYANVKALAEGERLVVHSHEVLRRLDGIEAKLNAARLHQKTFWIGEKDADREAFETAWKRLGGDVDRLSALVADNAGQLHRLTELRSAFDAEFAVLRAGMEIRARDDPATALQATPDRAAARVEGVLAEMRGTEDGLLRARSGSAEDNLRFAVASAAVAAAVGLLLIAIVYGLVRVNVSLRQRAADAVAAERERFRVTLRSIGEAVIVTDDAGRVTFMNEVARGLTRWGTEAIGEDFSTVFDIVNEQTGESVESPVMRVTRESAVVGLANNTILIAKDGTRVPIDDSGASIRDDEGNVLGAVLVFRDVTKRREEEEGRRRADEAKDEFLAMLAHELRSPLAAVRNAIAAADLEPSVRDRAIDIARRQTARLTRLVDDLLDVARITQRKIVLRKERLVLGTIVQRCVDTAHPYVEDRGQSLSITYPPEPIQLEADAVRLEQVIDNLVTNAVKYTPSGGKIELIVERSGTDAAIRVRDNGTGMEHDLVPRVFDLFAQGRRTPSRTDGGLGIGLTIVKLIVSLHGGSVEAKSEGPGKGSEFVVRLPALEVQHEGKSPPPPLVPAASRGEAPVLVVDDNFDAAEALTMLLQLLGFETDVAHDGREALEMASARRFGLIFVDIGLPGIDGYEVARRLNDSPGRRDIQVVALTGYGREEDRAKAMEAGFDLHLVKPVELETLEPLLARLERPMAASSRV